MNRVQIGKLDVVIARACNLNCDGCVTYSNFPNIKGILRWKDQRENIFAWLDRLDVKHLTLFGGEPLLNPDLELYVRNINEYLDKTDLRTGIHIQTNGIRLLQNLHIIKLACEIGRFNIDVSYHTSHPAAVQRITEGVEAAKQIIADTLPADVRSPLTITNYVGNLWVDHYKLDDNGLPLPSRDYDSDHYKLAHSMCHIKDFLNLYDGRLYKCPPMAVLNDFLDSYKIDNANWENWIDYKSCGIEDNNWQEWIENQQGPERVCNMCFDHPGRTIIHDSLPKYPIT